MNEIICFCQEQNEVLARNLASQISVTKPILFGLALKDKSPAILGPTMKVLNEHKCW